MGKENMVFHGSVSVALAPLIGSPPIMFSLRQSFDQVLTLQRTDREISGWLSRDFAKPQANGAQLVGNRFGGRAIPSR